MKKLLIVDDNPQNLYMLQVLLSAKGFQVEQAVNGAEALDCARRAPPDMIISDILMPVMDGYALCRAWKEDEKLKNIPFIFYSATYTEPKDQEFALKLGADRFILKPAEPDKFMDILLETEKDFEAGKLVSVCQPIEIETYYKEYNATLVRKLENKMLQLEKANRFLEDDIAERMQAEQEIRFRNIILTTQQETSIDGILVVNEKGGIISCNQRFVDMWALPAEVIESKSDERALQSALDKVVDPAEFVERVNYLYANRKERSNDEIALKDGHTFDRYSAPMFGPDNKYYGRVWYFRDITERKQAENALRENEQRYRMLFDDAKDGIALAEADTGRIVECNQALCRMVEKDKPEILGQKQSSIHPPQALPNGQSAGFIGHKNDDPGRAIEENLLSKSGALIPVEIRALRIEMNGREYMLGIFRDISIRKNLAKEKEQLQTQLLQAQKMEAVGTLAGGVAHDFNNLLTAISGYISLAMMKIDESDPVHRDLKQAGIAAGRAGNVVRQLLLFSRKQPAVELFSLNFNDTINNLLKMLRRLIGEDVAINTELAPGLWTIKGDEGNIEQVIMNLVVNARDAMPQGGTITIRTENIQIDEEYCKKVANARPGAFACLSISDTGTGIDAETMGHIFEPFFTTKEVGKGTGLGLSVVYGIVKQHDGWIAVESKLGEGTAFKMYLPSSYVKIERKTAEKIEMEKYKGKGERVLVVEDQDEVREFAFEVLTRNGYIVFPSENAQKARELFALEKGDFDLVFSDIVLPDVSGVRLFEELNSGRDLSALFSSGYSHDKAGLGVIKEKNYRFLQKPYSLQALLVAVREAIDSNQGRAQ